MPPPTFLISFPEQPLLWNRKPRLNCQSLRLNSSVERVTARGENKELKIIPPATLKGY